jgi:Zn-dependent oligopeptidase
MHKKNAKRTKGIYRAKSRIENEAEVQEGAPPLSPKFIKQLQITFGDKTMLSPRETRKVEDMIDKMSIENLKQLVSADIPHVSDMAKQYIRNNTPGGMKQEAEVQAPSHELSDMSRQASRVAQMIKRKINSGEQMDDRDYNQLAELGSVLSRLGASFGPKSMKDVMAHMKQYTDERNQEGHKYPEFDTNRFKELLAMAK